MVFFMDLFIEKWMMKQIVSKKESRIFDANHSQNLPNKSKSFFNKRKIIRSNFKKNNYTSGNNSIAVGLLKSNTVFKIKTKMG